MSFNVTRKFFAGCGITAAYNYRIKKTDDEKLKLNLMYAQEALRYTEEMLPEGAINYQDDLKGIPIETLIMFHKQRQECQQLVNEDIKPYDLENKVIEIVATVAKKYKRGNCGEQVAVAYTYLKNEKNLRKIDYLALLNGDHVFAVIGKDPLADVNDVANWGKAAVVCEPWGKRYFPAVELYEQLNQIAESPLYDPKVQSIGWNKNGVIPPEVTIRKWIISNQKTQKQFAKVALEMFDGKEDDDKLVKNCLMEYLEKKSKPKVPPKLSEADLKKVNEVYLQYISEKRQ
jgi:hypothetical protein